MQGLVRHVEAHFNLEACFSLEASFNLYVNAPTLSTSLACCYVRAGSAHYCGRGMQPVCGRAHYAQAQLPAMRA